MKIALFTCDTEFTPPWNAGSWTRQDRSTFEKGLEEILEILSKFDIRGTFYCQGLLVKDYPKLVCRLSERHLVGSHGYNHENYGGRAVNVYTKDEPVLLMERDKKFELLERCLKIHKEVLGIEPEAFVAPFDSIDYTLLEILEELNFRVDSSFDNYRLGLSSQLFKPASFNIYELPLSVIRLEKYGYRNILQGLTFDYSKIAEVISKELLFITCHPYEFVDIRVPHPRDVLIVGKEKGRVLEKLLQDLLKDGYAFMDPLRLIEQYESKENQ